MKYTIFNINYLGSYSLELNFRLIVIGWIKATFFKAECPIRMKVSQGAQNYFLLKTPKNIKKIIKSSEIRHGVDIRHGFNSYSLRMTVCNAYG